MSTTEKTTPQAPEEELRTLYRRCDISNNRTDDPIGEDEFVSYILAWKDAAVVEARKHEAADIHKAGFDILLKKGASAVVVGDTELDELLNHIERKYGKDLIHHVYGEHNQLTHKEKGQDR